MKHTTDDGKEESHAGERVRMPAGVHTKEVRMIKKDKEDWGWGGGECRNDRGEALASFCFSWAFGGGGGLRQC